MKEILDCRGLACPGPVINAKKAAEGFREEGTLSVLVDNETAVQNLTRLASGMGYAVKSKKEGEKDYLVEMEVKPGAAAEAAGEGAPSEDECAACAPEQKKTGTVVVLSSDQMGGGDEALGKKLMKAFVYALASGSAVPDKIICYNSGAFLSTEDPDTVRDLRTLEEAGASVMTCGTCLDYYGLKEKLQVGIVSNMYDIVEALVHAGSVIRP